MFHVWVYWNVYIGWGFGEMVMKSKMADITGSNCIAISTEQVVGSTVQHKWESEMNNLKPITTAHVSFLKNMEVTFCNGVLSFCFSFLFLSSKTESAPGWMSRQNLKDRRGWTLYQPEMSSGIFCVTFCDSCSCLTQVWDRQLKMSFRCGSMHELHFQEERMMEKRQS